MSQVPFESLIKFLQGIENAKGVALRVRKLEVKSDIRNREALRDINFTISMIKPNKDKEAASE